MTTQGHPRDAKVGAVQGSRGTDLSSVRHHRPDSLPYSSHSSYQYSCRLHSLGVRSALATSFAAHLAATIMWLVLFAAIFVGGVLFKKLVWESWRIGGFGGRFVLVTGCDRGEFQLRELFYYFAMASGASFSVSADRFRPGLGPAPRRAGLPSLCRLPHR